MGSSRSYYDRASEIIKQMAKVYLVIFAGKLRGTNDADNYGGFKAI